MTIAPFLSDVSTRTRDYRLHRVELHLAGRYLSSMLGPILKFEIELGFRLRRVRGLGCAL